MPYIHVPTSTYPVSEADIRAAHPNTSFATPFVEPDEYKVVFPTPVPAYNAITQGVREIAPELTNKGHWEQAWQVFSLDTETIAANQAAATAALIDAVKAATQARLDDFAKTRSYDGILSAATYATSTVPKFKAEGQYCVDARDQTWATLYAYMAEVQAGTKPMPAGYADIEPLLPALVWPS